MPIINDGSAPNVCAGCRDSSWSEVCISNEVAWCDEYKCACTTAIKRCEFIRLVDYKRG